MDHKKEVGFTLVELMIVIAIVSILATLAYPAWQTSIKKARRSDAIQSLQDLSINQAQWRANNATYATALASVGYAGGTSNEGHYTIAFVGTPDATTFVATAAPGGVQATDTCGTYSVNQDGPNQGGGYADAACWSQ